MVGHPEQERYIRLLLKAFLSGILICVLFYGMFFIFRKEPFSIYAFLRLHQNSPVFVLVDMFPFVLPAIVHFSVYRFVKYANILKKRLAEKDERIDHYWHAIDNLIDGHELPEEISESDDPMLKRIRELERKIKRSSEEAERSKMEEEKKAWISDGISRINEILRRNRDDIHRLTQEVLSYLIKYLKACQGGIFVINDENSAEIYLEQTASFAYGRNKYPDRRLSVTEGLIGACIQEKQTLSFSEIPDGYSHITSGLGDATPDHLIIVPLLYNDTVFGVIEVASFRPFEQHEFILLETAAENLAASIEALKITLRTARLLEETQKQARILSEQDVKMREQMEELRAMQEEAARQSEQMATFTNAVNHTLIRAEFATDGTLIYANTRFIYKLKYLGNADVEGKHVFTFIPPRDMSWFEPVWNNLASGGRHFEGYVRLFTKDGQEIWTMATYTCMRREDGSAERVLFLGIDTTEQRNMAIDIEAQAEALYRSVIYASFNTQGSILEWNKDYLDFIECTEESVKDTSLLSLTDVSYRKQYSEAWNAALKNNFQRGDLYIRTPGGNAKKARFTLTPVPDITGEIHKIILVAWPVEVHVIEKETEAVSIGLSGSPKEINELRMENIELRKKTDELQRILKAGIGNSGLSALPALTAFHELPEAVIIIDEAGKVVYLNNRAEKLLRITKESGTGMVLSSLLETDAEGSDEILKKISHGNWKGLLKKSHTSKLRLKSGDEILCTFRGYEIKDKEKGKYFTLLISA